MGMGLSLGEGHARRVRAHILNLWNLRNLRLIFFLFFHTLIYDHVHLWFQFFEADSP